MNTTIQPPTVSSTLTTKRQLHQPKCLFRSQTFWGIVFTTLAAIAPIVGEKVDEGKVTGTDISQIVVILCGAGATLVGRIEAGNVYTPDNMPGPNKADMN